VISERTSVNARTSEVGIQHSPKNHPTSTIPLLFYSGFIKWFKQKYVIWITSSSLKGTLFPIR
jgi:hypothetical protein